MITRKNLDELLAVLERIREEEYPDVSKEMVEQVAIAQYENQDDRGKARTETMRIVGEYASKFNDKEA